MELRKSATIKIAKGYNYASRRRLKVSVNKQSKEFTLIERRKHNSAAKLLEIVLNSLEFRDAISAKQFTSTPLMAWGVYDKIMTGQEDLSSEIDYKIDVDVIIYEENNNTVGYTRTDTLQTWVNRKFFREYEVGQIAGNMMHEYCHKIGFNHFQGAKEYTSVPYAAGYLVADLIKKWTLGTKFIDLYPDVNFIEPKRKHCLRDKKTLLLKKCCWWE